MKKIFIVPAVVLAFLLTACGNGGPGRVNGATKYVEVETDTGEKISCILYDADGGGGSITCNWNGVN